MSGKKRKPPLLPSSYLPLVFPVFKLKSFHNSPSVPPFTHLSSLPRLLRPLPFIQFVSSALTFSPLSFTSLQGFALQLIINWNACCCLKMPVRFTSQWAVCVCVCLCVRLCEGERFCLWAASQTKDLEGSLEVQAGRSPTVLQICFRVAEQRGTKQSGCWGQAGDVMCKVDGNRALCVASPKITFVFFYSFHKFFSEVCVYVGDRPSMSSPGCYKYTCLTSTRR